MVEVGGDGGGVVVNMYACGHHMVTSTTSVPSRYL